VLATVATLFFVPVVFSLLRRHGVPKPRFADDGVVLATNTARH
jgi:hypothetical protein